MCSMQSFALSKALFAIQKHSSPLTRIKCGEMAKDLIKSVIFRNEYIYFNFHRDNVIAALKMSYRIL